MSLRPPVGKYQIPLALGAVLVAMSLVATLMLTDDGKYLATATVSVRPETQVDEPLDTVRQFEAIDASNTMGTLTQVYASPEVTTLALLSLGLDTTAAELIDVNVSNSRDTLLVIIEAVGPTTEVSAVAEEIVTQGTALIEESQMNVILEPMGVSSPAPVTNTANLAFLLAAMIGFVGTLVVVAGVMFGGRPPSLVALFHRWVTGDPVPMSERAVVRSVVYFAALVALLAITASLVSVPVIGFGAVVGVATGLALLFALRYPQWLTVGLVLLVILHLSDVGTDFYGLPGFSVPYGIFVVLVVGTRHLLLGEDRGGWFGLALAMTALVAVMSISALTATDQIQALESTVDLAKNGFVAVLFVVLIREVADMRKVVWSLIIAASFLALLGIVDVAGDSVPGPLQGFAQAVEETVDEEVVSTRAAGPIGDANFFGQLLIMMLPFALERAFRDQAWSRRIAAALASISIGWAVVLTYSRGAFFGLVVSVFLLLAWLRPSLKVLLVGASISAMVLLSMPTAYLERIGTLGQVALIGSEQQAYDLSIQGRLSEMLVGLEMFHDHPVSGVGPGNYPGRYVEYSSSLGLDYRLEERQPHSLPIEVAAELGVLGMTWWLIGAVVLGRGLFRARRVAQSLGDQEMTHLVEVIVVSMAGFVTTAIFLHLAFARSFWMMVGIAVAAIRLIYANARVRRVDPEPEPVSV